MSPINGKPPRRWQQFTLRGLLILVTGAALCCGWFAWRLRAGHRQDDAVSAIVHAGGQVAYDTQFHSGVSRLTPYPLEESRVSGWLQTIFGTDPFRRLVSVKVHDDQAAALISQHALRDLTIVRLPWHTITDAALAHVRPCQRLLVLELDQTAITDAGLDHIAGCKEIEELWLFRTQVTDAGIKKIAHLNSLSCLDVRETQITDDGLKIIASLPAVSLLYIDGPSLTDEGLRALRSAPSLYNLWLGDQSSAKLNLVILRELPSLCGLTLSSSLVTDESIARLADNDRIEYLHLQGCTKLSDAALLSIAKMPKLVGLHLDGTTFTPQAINEFKVKRPACNIW